MSMIIGVVVAMILMIFSIVLKDSSIVFSQINNFLNAPSALITFGGAFMATLAMSPSVGDFISRLKSITLTVKNSEINEENTIKQIIDLANVARKEGLLSVEEAANSIEERFLKKGVLLIVDGTDPELVRSILENEIVCIDNRHRVNIGFWEDLASMGPSWGMIGTLIGLINMLSDMGDVSTVGPNMSVALITTFYGSVLANWLCTPIANKLKARNEEELKMKDMMVEGILSIQAGENPRVIEEKLKAFLNAKSQDEFAQKESEASE